MKLCNLERGWSKAISATARTLCVSAALLISANGFAQDASTVIVRPAEIQDVLANPGMGIQTFERFDGDALSPGEKWSEEGPMQVIAPPQTAPDFPKSTVAYCRWFWSQLEPEQGKVRWDVIDTALREAHAHGQRLAIRLAIYDQDHPLPEWYRRSGAKRANTPASKDGNIWQPDFSDELYLKYWGALVSATAQRYDGDPDLDSVDISTVGYWGEGWSDYMPPLPVQERLIDLYLDGFHQTPVLMNFDEPDALRYGTAHGAGWRFDCLGNMSKPWSEMLDQYPEEIAETGIGDVWKSAPVSMEACWVPATWAKRGWDVTYILNEALRWHISTLNVKSTALPPEWKQQFEDFERKMGYRFVLRRASWNREVRAGDSLGLKTWWVNEGVAPVYRDYILAFRFDGPGGSAVLQTPAEVRRWLPGDAVFNGPLFVPRTLAAGSYGVSVALLDPATMQPAVRLAMEGRGQDGWYRLGSVQVQAGE